MTLPLLLDIAEVDIPRELHRIVPIERLLSLLSEAQNALVYPAVWNDPYEAVQLRTALAGPAFMDSADGAIKVGAPFIGAPIRVGQAVQESPANYEYYCQSWSASVESETMWRAYSPSCDAVRISVSTVELIRQAARELHDHAVYLGRVAYSPREDIERLAAKGIENRQLQWSRAKEGDPWGISWARSLLQKRDAFRHEEEFRLVAVRGKTLLGSKTTSNLLFHRVDPPSLITKVLLDPRCKSQADQEASIRLAGFAGQVRKSTLFDPPALQVWNSPHPQKWTP